MVDGGEVAVQGVKSLGMATLGPAVSLSMSRSALWGLGVALWPSCTLGEHSVTEQCPQCSFAFHSETGFAKLLKLA